MGKERKERGWPRLILLVVGLAEDKVARGIVHM